MGAISSRRYTYGVCVRYDVPDIVEGISLDIGICTLARQVGKCFHLQRKALTVDGVPVENAELRSDNGVSICMGEEDEISL